MYIGLISDTHGVFDNEFRRFLDPVDVVWHAGDWGGDEGFPEVITSFKPVVGVYGNCDGYPLRLTYPLYQSFDCCGMRVLMTHIGGYPGHYSPEAKGLILDTHPDLFVCGHSHILKVMYDRTNEMLTVNPGAAGIQGWHLVRTALRFHIDDGAVHGMEVFELPRTKS